LRLSRGNRRSGQGSFGDNASLQGNREHTDGEVPGFGNRAGISAVAQSASSGQTGHNGCENNNRGQSNTPFKHIFILSRYFVYTTLIRKFIDRRVMEQTSRRPLRRRRSPLPLIIVLAVLFLCSATTGISCNRVNSGTDAAYAKLTESNIGAGELDLLVQKYMKLESKRFQDSIKEDYQSVKSGSAEMNDVLAKIGQLENSLDAKHKTDTENFKNSARWLFFFTARRGEAARVIQLCDAITVLQSRIKPLRIQRDAMVVEENNLYIKYANDDISGEEFSGMKADIETKLSPVTKEISILTEQTKTLQGQIAEKSDTFGVKN
jgi:hypothetical protein